MTSTSPFRPWLPWLVLLTCVALAVIGTASIAGSGRAQDRLRIHSTAQDLQAGIEARVETYLALLRAGTALFAASEGVRRREFAQFIAQLELRQRFAGIQGIGYARRVDAEAIPALEAEMHLQGLPTFQVWPREPPRSVYTSIVFLEPPDERNQKAVGYDMFSEPVRRAAMERAAAEGRPIASGKVTLVQERVDPAHPQAGFLIYVPLFHGGRAPESVADRVAALQGWVYAPFRAGDFLNAVLQPENRRRVRLRLYDGEVLTPAALLYDSSGGPDPPRTTSLREVRRLMVAGQPWTMDVTTLPAFASSSRNLVPSLLSLGLAVSVLLFLLTRGEARARADLERTAVELRHSEQALQAANRAKDEFLATLSHELRTPLNAILGWTRMLRTGALDSSRHEAALAIVERNARAQAKLVEDILDVSRIITGKLRLDVTAMALNPIIEEAVTAIRPAAEAKGVTLECRLDPAVGTIIAAADRVQQIAWNLLSNAIKFTPEGGQVRVTTQRSADAIRLEVSDTGVGIDPAFLPHVFDRFSQADSSTTRAHSGVGLGLAIVRHLVELHGGRIDAASRGPGRGATFTVVLPVRAAAREHGAPPAADAAPLPGPRPLAGVRVLVLDDDDDARIMLATALAFEGAEAREASTVEDALAGLARADVDVVVSDLAMPGEDGYALVRRLRESPVDRLRGVPVIALTAYARADNREDVIAQGFQGFVPKPVDLPELVAAIRGVLPPGAGDLR